MIRIVLRKELLDIKRDRKLLLGSIILPLILLPLIGVILYASVAASPPVVEIINYNESNLPYIENITSYLRQEGIIVLYNSSNVTPDAILVFPANFSYNVSHINRQATLQLSIIVSSNQQAINDIYNALSELDSNLVIQRVTTLINRSHIANLTPREVLNPILVAQTTITVTHKVVPQSQANLGEIVRIVALVLFPSSTPVIFYVTDGIVGEKERRTLESLLASPISIRSFIFSKVIMSIILGILSSLGDIVGIIIFSSLLSFAFNTPITVSLPFLFIIVGIYLLTVLLTASLSVILLVGLGGSMRNVQLINFLVLGFGLIASFSALFVNVANVSFPFSLVLLIPYEQLSLSLLYYVAGLPFISIAIMLATLMVSILILLISSKLFNSERLLLK